MKYLYTLLLLCTCIYPAMGQYLLEEINEPYTEISNPTYEIPDTSIYFGNVTEKPDMYFEAFEQQYDLYDGVDIPIKQGYFFFINSNYSTTIYPAKGEYAARPGQGQTSIFSFATQGSPGNQIHTLQWKNMGFANGDSTDYINFQVRLHESTGFIDFHYGPSSVGANLYENGANGPTVGLLEMNAAFSIIYNSHWLQGNPASPTVVSSTNVINLASTPANGTVYRFKPDGGTGVKEITQSGEEVSVYPTLIEQSKTLQISTALSNYTFKVHDVTGRELMAETGLSGNEAIDISTLRPGLFLVSVNGEYLTKIMVK